MNGAFRMISVLYLLLFTLTGCLALENQKTWNPLEQKLMNFLDNWRNGSRDNEYYLPSLDFIQIPPVEGQFQESGVKLQYSTSEMILQGLNNFTVENLSASVEHMNASMEVLVQTLVLTADQYRLQGRAYLLYPLKGSGKLTVQVRDTWLSAAIQLRGNETSTWINKVELDFDVEEIKVDLAGSSWPINTVLNNQGLNILEKYHDYIVSVAEDYLTLYVNEYLSAFNSTDLLGSI